MKFSANLGFLWTDRPLLDAIRAARSAGFDAVEMHWPYDTPAEAVRAELDETGLPLLCINTFRGEPGQNGLSALPGKEADARKAIDQALDYALSTGCRAIHAMAGFSRGPRAHDSFCANLDYAARAAGPHGIDILIEPLNHYDAPGYFLETSAQAVAIIREVGHENLRLMFDCYHLQIMEGDLSRRLERCLPFVGHIQIAAVPDRGPPDRGELDYAHVFNLIEALGWDLPIGAEYKPNGDTDASLGWLASLR